MTLKFLNQSETKLLAIKGVLSAIFGFTCVIALFFEDKNFTILAYSLGVTAIISGLITLISMINTKVRFRNFGLFHYEGLTSLLLGMWMLTFPFAAINIFMGLLGGICAGMGLIQIALAFDLNTFKVKEGVLIYSGILTVLLGVILLNNPDAIAGFVNLALGVFFSLAGGRIIRSTRKKLKASHSQVDQKQTIKTPSLQKAFTYAAMPVEQQQSTME
jgi:uncharacterized membrane protein HdeD (DUF308 family)